MKKLNIREPKMNELNMKELSMKELDFRKLNMKELSKIMAQSSHWFVNKNFETYKKIKIHLFVIYRLVLFMFLLKCILLGRMGYPDCTLGDETVHIRSSHCFRNTSTVGPRWSMGKRTGEGEE